ncbi:hypothetical protein [Streptomyces sp. NPDC059076]|uniref:hypothetical protein n=1 Tax=unclassified Streptomyces TaxID=2593676 RepID=UPI0036C92126
MTRTKPRRRTRRAKATTTPTTSRPTVDLRHRLPTRPIVGPPTELQLTEARAVLAAATARLPIPSLAWLAAPNGTAYAQLRDATLLHHTPTAHAPFTAHIPCPNGARHTHHIHDLTTLNQARAEVAACTTQHGTDDNAQALTRGVQPTPAPQATRRIAVITPIRTLRTLTEDTQSTDVTELRRQPTEEPTEDTDHA